MFGYTGSSHNTYNLVLHFSPDRASLADATTRITSSDSLRLNTSATRDVFDRTRVGDVVDIVYLPFRPSIGKLADGSFLDLFRAMLSIPEIAFGLLVLLALALAIMLSRITLVNRTPRSIRAVVIAACVVVILGAGWMAYLTRARCPRRRSTRRPWRGSSAYSGSTVRCSASTTAPTTRPRKSCSRSTSWRSSSRRRCSVRWCTPPTRWTRRAWTDRHWRAAVDPVRHADAAHDPDRRGHAHVSREERGRYARADGDRGRHAAGAARVHDGRTAQNAISDPAPLTTAVLPGRPPDRLE